jgi:hypothetical protein
MMSCAVRMPNPALSGRNTLPVSSDYDLSRDALVPVYLLADSLHTSLALPYDWLVESGFCPPPNLQFSRGPSRYVVMSWGDRIAYEQRRWLKPSEVFYALCMPSPSVTEIIPVSWKVEEVCYQQRIFKRDIPRRYGRQLATFLNSSNRFDADGHPKVIGPSSWGQGVLLDSQHSYYFPRICNVWTAQALESCGLKINIRKAIHANSLIKQAQKQGFEWVHRGHATSDYGREAARPRDP